MRASWRRAVFAFLAVSGCGGGDDPDRVIAADEIVHEQRLPGAPYYQVAVTPLDGSASQQLTQMTNSAHLPSVSPDGRRIVFQVLSRLWLLDVHLMEVRQFTFGPSLDGSPSWSPDGQRIVYSSRRVSWPETYDICIREVSGGEPSCLTEPDEFDDMGPDMSPDGTRIVWQRGDPDHYIDLWIMDADGSNQRLLLDHSDYDTSPQWSPDGRFILFRSFRYGPPCQFILELATGAIRPVLGDSLDPAFMESATWGPDGQSVIIEVLNPNNRFALVDLATGDAHFINDDTLSYNNSPSMRR